MLQIPLTGGIFTAYELKENNPQLRILIIEKGHSIERRKCPKRETGKCMHCKPCAITTGFSGAGAFSDGKLSLSPDVGGTLPEILGYDEATKLIREEVRRADRCLGRGQAEGNPADPCEGD